MSKRRGFTLIELLVVIAIIGILAAMLFPVFARARESARKTQCLANVKNIAIAVNMYLADYEMCPPGNTDQNLTDWVDSLTLSSKTPRRCDTNGGAAQWAWRANPYLRWPVILDDYIKNRDIWKCPSARLETGATFIVPMGPNGRFQKYLADTTDKWGDTAQYYGFGICSTTWPTGWGGDVTDSIIQQKLAGNDIVSMDKSTGKVLRSFVQSVAYNGNAVGINLSTVQDSAKYVICSDGGGLSDAGSPTTIAYPDICCAECSGVAYYAWTWPPSHAEYCKGYCDDCYYNHATIDFARDTTLRKTSTRHMGGSNVGFLDGHAKWFQAQSILSGYSDRSFEGIPPFCNTTTKEGYDAEAAAGNCAARPAGMIFLIEKPK